MFKHSTTQESAADVHTKVIKSYVCCTCIFMSFLFCIRWDPSDELTLVKKRLHVCPTSFSKGGSQQHMVRSLRCHLNFKLSPWIKSPSFPLPMSAAPHLKLISLPYQPLPGFNLLCVVIYDTAAGNSSIYHVCMRLLFLLLPNIINGVIFWGQLNVKIDF